MKKFSKERLPTAVLMYEGPVLASIYFSGFIYCAYKLATCKEVANTVKVVLVLCCVMLAAAGLWWLDYYADYPLWLYGVLEFWQIVLEVSVLERLSSSWLTIYRRHVCLSNGHETYSQTLQRNSFIGSVCFQVSFVCLYVVLFSAESTLLRDVSYIYFSAVELLFFIPYLVYSAARLNSIIRHYLDSTYTRKVTFIAKWSVITVGVRLALVVYLLVDSSTPDYPYEKVWGTVLFNLMFVFSFGFLLTIFAVLLYKSKDSQLTARLSDSLNHTK